MSNTPLTSTEVTRECLRILHQKLNFVGTINRQYDNRFAQEGAKIGDTLKIRLPNQYVVTDGAVMTAQDTKEESVDLKVQSQKHVGMNFSSAELTLSIDDFSERIIEPAMTVLASKVEADAMSMYKDVYQQIDNQGSAATLVKLLMGRKQLVDALAPLNSRYANLNTQDNVDLVDALKGLFQDSSAIKEQYREGLMGRTAGFDFYENTLWPTHARGAGDAAYTTDTRVSALPISATAVSQVTVASGTGAMPKGEIFTIGNVFRVHPETKDSTGVKQQFVVTEDYAGGAGTLKFSPAIVLDGAKKNVVIPTTSATAAIVIAGTASTAYGISMLYQKDAFAFATADLILPKGIDFASREVVDGISLRVVRQYDINNDKLPCRVDILYGYKTLRAQLASRYANK